MSDGLVRYARNGDVHLAYRLFGESGPVLVTRAMFATVDWLQFCELAKLAELASRGFGTATPPPAGQPTHRR